jgi:hypothetical protein
VDLYFLRKIVRPGGLIVIDDDWTPSVRTALRYYEQNLGWTAIPDTFASGTLRHIGDSPTGQPVPRLPRRPAGRFLDRAAVRTVHVLLTGPKTHQPTHRRAADPYT